MKNRKIGKTLAWLLLISLSGTAQTGGPATRKVNITVNKPTTAISRDMWGIFFEDINFGADGGLYAELIKNGSFEFPAPMMGWRDPDTENQGSILIVNQAKHGVNPRYARLKLKGTGDYVLINDGFRGIGIQKDETYLFSIMAKQVSGQSSIRLEMINAKGNVIGKAEPVAVNGDWKKYNLSFTASDTAQKGKLRVIFNGNGELHADRLSLFPQHTWKNRPNGLRNDLVQKLADLKPGFLRFPGGCIVEGKDITNRYQWKTTVGAPEERKLIMNRWNVEFAHRSAPDYYQSFGLGFYEYFLLAEDLGASPLPIINCGMACQFNSAEVVSLPELDPYIQDALDLIEFANGDVSTKWGKVRADMGHPAPFNMRLLGVGNEQWDEQYVERYALFEKILKKKYPEVKLVAAAGPYAEGAYFEYAWKAFQSYKPDFIDEHYYKGPDWFLKNAARYDNYDRNGFKVFAGEYAGHGKDNAQAESKNSWLSAMSEAAFMTGLERNADVVQMCSYAPLLAHVDAWQWRPDLIWFDNLRSMATPNYYVQQLYGTNKGTHSVPALLDGRALSGKDSLYASAVIDTTTKELIIKLVNAGEKTESFEFNLAGIKTLKGEMTITTLRNEELLSYNTLDKPIAVQPVSTQVLVKGKKIVHVAGPRSFSVLRVKYQ
ncbi:MAG TPA: alpha-L-arabinofuranosidase C-terminal domain-containing protein [Chitinophagaceae bacterium]|nr:alpha-L-arabinofuranosidase C-terminal domain-containing protein [Chitinophagaceae bacterium]